MSPILYNPLVGTAIPVSNFFPWNFTGPDVSMSFDGLFTLIPSLPTTFVLVSLLVPKTISPWAFIVILVVLSVTISKLSVVQLPILVLDVSQSTINSDSKLTILNWAFGASVPIPNLFESDS